jgi:hypothetical protein
VSLARLIRPTTRSRHRGAAGGTDAHRGRRRGHLGRVARRRSAVALADRLGMPLVGFPGDHGGFMALPEQFGRVLDQVLTQQ